MPPMIATLLIRYGLPALGAALALWGAYSWAYGRGVEATRAKLVPQIELCQDNAATFEAATAAQNERLDELRIAGEEARKAGEKAAQDAAQQRKRIAPSRPALEAARAPMGAVTVPDAVHKTWREL